MLRHYQKIGGGFLMILFTSDLDRTLIYSKRMMQKYPVEGELLTVEHKEDEAVSFMSQHSMDLLQTFHSEHLFVPVTTRALHQYERIHTIAKVMKPKFAITSNGGTLLIEGKRDMEWDKLIRGQISSTSLANEDMLKAFAQIHHPSWINSDHYIEDLFYMFRVNRESIPYRELAAFEKELVEMGWKMFLHGKKLYILPYYLSKAWAVKHLQSYVDYDIHVAAGDSILDYDMIVQADIGYSPTHGELFGSQETDSKVRWLNEKGVASTEELLSQLLKSNETLTAADGVRNVR
jgi:hydroxymethylpyrimidine pyrophosphatase-like HAD family hydrolase